MQGAARMALGAGGGYLLGRTKKVKLAITLGSMVAGKKMSGPSGLLGQGVDLLRQSPDFYRLREQLMGAGRSAAMTAATSSLARVSARIESRGDDDSDAD